MSGDIPITKVTPFSDAAAVADREPTRKGFSAQSAAGSVKALGKPAPALRFCLTRH
jgi:hypothetical protein